MLTKYGKARPSTFAIKDAIGSKEVHTKISPHVINLICFINIQQEEEQLKKMRRCMRRLVHPMLASVLTSVQLKRSYYAFGGFPYPLCFV